MNRDELNKRRDELAEEFESHSTENNPIYAEDFKSGFNAATEILMPEITEYKERYSHACIELRFYDQLLDERNKEIKQLTAQLSKAREVLKVVVERGDEC